MTMLKRLGAASLGLATIAGAFLLPSAQAAGEKTLTITTQDSHLDEFGQGIFRADVRHINEDGEAEIPVGLWVTFGDATSTLCGAPVRHDGSAVCIHDGRYVLPRLYTEVGTFGAVTDGYGEWSKGAAYADLTYEGLVDLG